MSTNTEVKKAMLSLDNILVDENNLEIPLNSIIHCLGSLFQVSNAGLRHTVGKKIDNDTYFTNSELHRQLNELAFVEQSDVRNTPDCKVLLPVSSLVVHKIYCVTLGNVARVYPWIIQGLTFLSA